MGQCTLDVTCPFFTSLLVLYINPCAYCPSCTSWSSKDCFGTFFMHPEMEERNEGALTWNRCGIPPILNFPVTPASTVSWAPGKHFPWCGKGVSEWVGNIWTQRPTGRGFRARAGGWRACHVLQGWGMIQYLRETGLEVLLWHVGKLRMSSCGVELAPAGLARSLFIFCPKGLCLSSKAGLPVKALSRRSAHSSHAAGPCGLVMPHSLASCVCWFICTGESC